jgi:hypothetical protein
MNVLRPEASFSLADFLEAFYDYNAGAELRGKAEKACLT